MIYFSIALLIPTESLSNDTQKQHLFKIERNKNANIVAYDAYLDSDGNLEKTPLLGIGY